MVVNTGTHQHIFSVLVENRFGVLARIAGLFASRGYNIDSLAVGETHDPSVSRMTIVATGDDRIFEQIQKQLNKIIDVIKVQDLSREEHIERELVLIKVRSNPKSRSDIVQIVDIFQAKIIDVRHGSVTVEIVGTQDKIEAILDLLRPYGIREVARTGRIALSRG